MTAYRAGIVPQGYGNFRAAPSLRRTLARRPHAVHRVCTAAANHDDERETEREQVILVALAVLSSCPIHEEAHVPVNHRDRDQHDYGDPEGRHPRQSADEQSERPQELSGDREHRERNRNAELARHEPDRSRKTVPAVPAQHLLSAMRKHDDSECDASEQWRYLVTGGHQAAHQGVDRGPGAGMA